MKLLDNQFFAYGDTDQVSVGDIVRLDGEHPATSAFATSIVTDIDEGGVHLARPHMRAEKIGCTKGTPLMMTEQYTVPVDLFIQRYIVHSTGRDPDNRGRVI